MLSGQCPFPEAEEQQIFMQLDKDPTPAKEILPKVSESCRRFLEKTLAIDPKGRATARSLLNDQFVLGTELPDIETDAELENFEIENEPDVLDERQEGMAESKQQAGATNINYSPHIETHHTYNIQGDVKFKKDVHVDKIETLRVERLENLNANQVEHLEAYGASAVDVTGATKVKATAAQNSNLNVARAEIINADQANTINIENLDYLHIS